MDHLIDCDRLDLVKSACGLVLADLLEEVLAIKLAPGELELLNLVLEHCFVQITILSPSCLLEKLLNRATWDKRCFLEIFNKSDVDGRETVWVGE